MLNIEKYTTADERARAFDKWCDARSCDKCELRTIYLTAATGSVCPIVWLDQEAEEEKIEDCPYCGGSCLVSNGAVGKYRVFCEKNLSCMYSSGAYVTEHEAIAAHNRVARAVMEAGKKEKK